jgi:hypothetical protein
MTNEPQFHNRNFDRRFEVPIGRHELKARKWRYEGQRAMRALVGLAADVGQTA